MTDPTQVPTPELNKRREIMQGAERTRVMTRRKDSVGWLKQESRRERSAGGIDFLDWEARRERSIAVAVRSPWRDEMNVDWRKLPELAASAELERRLLRSRRRVRWFALLTVVLAVGLAVVLRTAAPEVPVALRALVPVIVAGLAACGGLAGSAHRSTTLRALDRDGFWIAEEKQRLQRAEEEAVLKPVWEPGDPELDAEQLERRVRLKVERYRLQQGLLL